MSACNLLTVLSGCGATWCRSASNNHSKSLKTRSLAGGRGDVTVFKDPKHYCKAKGNTLFFTSNSDKAGRTGSKLQQFPAALGKFAADAHLRGDQG